LTPIQTNSVFIVNLGCAKNLVDANVISQILNSAGYKHARSMREANFVIINTCGFIHDARVESQEVIADALKNRRKGQFVIASGCLSQRLNAELYEQFPALDGLIGTRNLQDVLLLLDDLSKSAIPKHNTLPAYPKLKVDANLYEHRHPGWQQLSQNRGWLPPHLRFLCHTFDKRASGKPPRESVSTMRSSYKGQASKRST